MTDVPIGLYHDLDAYANIWSFLVMAFSHPF